MLFILGASGWFFWQAYDFLQTAPQREGRDIYLDVAPGAHLGQIAKELAAKGLVTDARKFALYARYKKMGGKLQAGRFLLNSGWKPEEVLETLVNGRPALYRVTVPEGLTLWQTGRLLEDAGLLRFEDFYEAVTDPAFLAHYGIPFATAEGFLMPDTYLLRKPDMPLPPPAAEGERDSPDIARAREEWRAQARSVAGRLVDNFWRKAASLWPSQPLPLKEQAPKSPEAASTSMPEEESPAGKITRPAMSDLKIWVTLASIVERETGVPSERARVAGVYANRLKKNMLLQADPTVIYGLGPGFSGTLRRAHLSDPLNAYNTYHHAGLPPGPIASFGMAALKAAIAPEKHNYLYFVASGTGPGHIFSRTYEEHEAAVREYRRQKNDG